MEANAALGPYIVRRDIDESYREMLTSMAQESGVATPTIDDAAPIHEGETTTLTARAPSTWRPFDRPPPPGVCCEKTLARDA
jgi:hypothetical protein